MKRRESVYKSKKSNDTLCVCFYILLTLFISLLITTLIVVIITNIAVIRLALFYQNFTTNNLTSEDLTKLPGDRQTTKIIPSDESALEIDEFERSCGISYYESDISRNYRLNKRIINGAEAAPHSFPFVVSLYEEINNRVTEHFCGGALISEYHVITAAHCVIKFLIKTREQAFYLSDNEYNAYVKSKKANRILVAVGLHGHDKANITNHLYIVEKFTFHDGFSMSSCCQDDISILKLEKPVKFDKKVNLICLPFSLKNFKSRVRALKHNDNIVLAGWGLTSASGVQANSLQQAVLRIKEDDKLCNGSDYWKHRTVYCHIDDFKNSAVCNADSGSPIMVKYEKRWYIMGVVSHFAVDKDKKNSEYGHYDCLPHNPSFSVKLDNYAGWIKKHLEEF